MPDCEIALAQLAHHNRQLSDALVIGVTGSVGKTTTRSMISCVLHTTHTGIQSPHNFNNHLGVPLSLLDLQQGDEFAVIEIGSSAPGETAALTQIVEPEFGVVTRVTPAHLRELRSMQLVQQEKEQLIKALPGDGIAFLNVDDPLVAQMSSAAACRVVRFGTSAEADVRMTDVDASSACLTLVADGFRYTVPACGRHNSTAALAAVALGIEVGIRPSEINAGLQQFHSPAGRCNVCPIGAWTVIDDTYNSSPASVAAAIRTAEDFEQGHHRILVLGDMLDLGDQSADLHYGIGGLLAASEIDHVFVTGGYAEDVVDGFLATGGLQNRISVFSDLNLLVTMLECLASESDVILVKGSRATAMERVVESLKECVRQTDVTVRRAA